MLATMVRLERVAMLLALEAVARHGTHACRPSGQRRRGAVGGQPRGREALLHPRSRPTRRFARRRDARVEAARAEDAPGVASPRRLLEAPLITLDKLTKRFGPKILFGERLDAVRPGKRYVLVGANGAGKSTLIRSSPATRTRQGAVDIPSKLKIGVLRQDHFAYEKTGSSTRCSWATRPRRPAIRKERLFDGPMTDEVGP